MDTKDAGQQKRFCEVVGSLKIDLQVIADLANVPREAIDAIFVGEIPVSRIYVERVCEFLSCALGQPVSIDTAAIPTKPTTFADLFLIYQFSPHFLGLRANVTWGTVEAMIDDEPVPKKAAEWVLAALSRETGQTYTLENVQVELKADTWSQNYSQRA